MGLSFSEPGGGGGYLCFGGLNGKPKGTPPFWVWFLSLAPSGHADADPVQSAARLQHVRQTDLWSMVSWGLGGIGGGHGPPTSPQRLAGAMGRECG